jgi:hypothetical protein
VGKGKKKPGFWEENFPEMMEGFAKIKRDREQEKKDYYDRHHPDLDSMTAGELETLYAQLQVEVSALEARHTAAREFAKQAMDHPDMKKSPLGGFFGLLASRIPDSPLAQRGLIDKKKLMEAIKVKLKSLQPSATPRQTTSAPQLSKEELKLKRVQDKQAEWQRVRATVTDQHVLAKIDEMYRQAIDDILDS